jgi:dTDP-4-amino-4,6-dideoxygalactose transaminase
MWRKYRAALRALPGVRVQSGLAEIPPAVLSVRSPLAAAEVARALAASSIETRRWYVPPLHHQSMFAGAQRVGEPGGTLPVTDDLATHSIGVPFHLFLSDENIGAVCQALAACLGRPTS